MSVRNSSSALAWLKLRPTLGTLDFVPAWANNLSSRDPVAAIRASRRERRLHVLPVNFLSGRHGTIPRCTS